MAFGCLRNGVGSKVTSICGSETQPTCGVCRHPGTLRPSTHPTQKVTTTIHSLLPPPRRQPNGQGEATPCGYLSSSSSGIRSGGVTDTGSSRSHPRWQQFYADSHRSVVMKRYIFPLSFESHPHDCRASTANTTALDPGQSSHLSHSRYNLSPSGLVALSNCETLPGQDPHLTKRLVSMLVIFCSASVLWWLANFP